MAARPSALCPSAVTARSPAGHQGEEPRCLKQGDSCGDAMEPIALMYSAVTFSHEIFITHPHSLCPR